MIRGNHGRKRRGLGQGLAAVLGVAVIALASCGSSGPSNSGSGSKPMQTVKILMDWFPEPTQGGFWEAAAENLGKKYGIKLDIEQGGPQVQQTPQVASGRVDFAWGGADTVMLARAHGTPLVSVFAGFQNFAQCIMYHPGTGISSPADLNHHQLAVSLGAAFWQWLKNRYKLNQVQVVGTTGSINQWRANKNLAQQCYITDEPYEASQAGIPHSVFWFPDLGYNPYYTLYTSQRMLNEHPQLVKDVVAIARKGWQDYMKNPHREEAFIYKANSVYNPGHYDFTIKTMKQKIMNPNSAQIGCMTEKRWKQLDKNLIEAKLIQPSFNYKEAVSFKYVTGCGSA